jgi:hypothetical protein
MDKLIWERIESETQNVIGCKDPALFMRAPVPGGWLIRSRNEVQSTTAIRGGNAKFDTGFEHRTALVFIPDPDHTWKF